MFVHLGEWHYVAELLIACNLLALIIAIGSVTQLEELSWLIVLQYMLFTSWIAIGFCVLVTKMQRIFSRLHTLAGILFLCFILLQTLILLTTICMNALMFKFTHSGGIFDISILLSNSLHRMLLGTGIAVLCLRYIYIRDQWMMRRQSELMARVQALQSRIHPHFLFNSLNSVVSLISIDPLKAEQMLIDLSSLFRASLTELKEVSLKEEIDLCRRYLKIEMIRLGERLEVEWRIDADQDLNNIKIPLLTLQPLLENCIHHGVETLAQSSLITILIEVIEQRVNIVLTNPYQKDMQTHQGNGIAMENVKQRLLAYYGRSVHFKMSARHGNFTTLLSYQWRQ
ncbi:alginate biosynthesis protein [Acinetobacter qingfengensis]|uniref:Signal transduction histidine kinase internal region domain-containing protein n=2 Tax=Acinetobacter qingfengensis TaxID=1262585 RepID=A0A1E7RD04_9GAMM|nr:alginate biosynthesis protein [Acinetobacter qingfengensis]OEY97289.1 hypothetical protein BJI46_02250 [Acinetobacter qingfengensis]